MSGDHRQLWSLSNGKTGERIDCVMISCCDGAELQVRRRGETLLRELYPTKSDLYERAQALRTQFAASALSDMAGGLSIFYISVAAHSSDRISRRSKNTKNAKCFLDLMECH